MGRKIDIEVEGDVNTYKHGEIELVTSYAGEKTIRVNFEFVTTDDLMQMEDLKEELEAILAKYAI